MRAYELMIIYVGEIEDADVEKALASVGTAVEAGGGRVVKIDRWGRRRFAYEIDHRTEGIYVVLEIVTESRDLHDLSRSLRLADEVVRHKIIRLPDHEAARRGLVGEATPADAG